MFQWPLFQILIWRRKKFHVHESKSGITSQKIKIFDQIVDDFEQILIIFC